MYDLIYIVACLLVVLLCMRPLGWYMARVYSGKPVWLKKKFGFVESWIYRTCRISPDREMGWREYAWCVLLFGAMGCTLLFVIFISQGALPLNPEVFPGLPADLAFNAAVSFLTNTNWQSYSGETMLSYFSQMAGCTVQNFVSAATGMAVAVALFRGLARKQSATIGNFWVDVVRGILYILLPMALMFALFLASQGVVQNLSGYTVYKSLEGVEGVIAQGPAASQVAIKMLGSNGGGFFNANSAHPFENPGFITNFLQLTAILLISAALLYTFGIMVGDRRQGWMMLMAMMAMLLPMLYLSMYWETQSNPKLPAIVEQSAGNMEGKEARIGAGPSAAWSVLTTATSNGSVNSMHDSYMPLSGLAPMLLMQFGEVVFGGVGVGVYGMLMYMLIAVFIGGLMVGRAPEYLGKKIGVHEIKVALLIIIIPPTMTLFGTALAVSTEVGRAAVFNPGAQGFSELLYAFASVSNNNGSAFAGLQPYSTFYHLTFGFCMLFGRYALITLALAIAGALAAKNITPASAGTLPTHTPLFAFMLVVVILLNALTYIPAVALGPVAEHVHLFAVGEVKP